jgi:hypothetical protein
VAPLARKTSPGGGAWIPPVALAVLLALLLAPAGPAAHAAGDVNPPHAQERKQLGKGRKRKRKHRPLPIYWGAWIGDQLTGTQPPWDMSAVSKFEGLVGKGLSLVEFGMPFAQCRATCQYYDFPAKEVEAIRSYGAIPLLSWSSTGDPESVDSDPLFRFSSLIAGNQDAHIREFAEAARNWGHPFFLRFNWEMNGNWFPWSEGVNGNQPGEFVAAWRHVRDIFTAVGATNASWVWCPYADPAKKFGGVGRFYPGDAYVDWTCMDGYNWAKNPTNPHPWRSFDEIFRSTYMQIIKHVAPGKPMMLGEIASTGSGKQKAAWVRGMFDALATDYRRIRALVWFNQVDRGVDWPLETSPLAARAFGKGIRHWSFRKNQYASISSSPIGAP